MPITTRSLLLLAPLGFMAACAADWPALEGCDDGCIPPMSTSTTSEAPPTTTAIQTVTGGSGDDATGTGSPDTSGADTPSTSQSGATSETGSDETILPEVVAIELPAEVNAAGPVPITVLTNGASVRVKLDGVDVGELVDAGDELFAGELAVKGAIDNGTRHVEVIATLGEYEDSKGASFEVKVPEAGKPAWAKPGPLGSRTNRIALTPGGDVIEAGLRIGAGIPRPSVHKRSGFDGSDLWPKKVLLSELEGHVADVAIAPDGGIWVAMNVKEASQKWRPHILLLAPDGSPTGVDEPGTLGDTLRAIAADEEGGCFGVGYAVVDGGDLDVVAVCSASRPRATRPRACAPGISPRPQPRARMAATSWSTRRAGPSSRGRASRAGCSASSSAAMSPPGARPRRGSCSSARDHCGAKLAQASPTSSAAAAK
jgi:hypothetical protein